MPAARPSHAAVRRMMALRDTTAQTTSDTAARRPAAAAPYVEVRKALQSTRQPHRARGRRAQ